MVVMGMDYYGPMKLALCLAAALSLPLGVWAQTSPADDDAPPAVPSVMDASLFYQVLVGEMEAQRGNAVAGSSLLLDAARKNRDPGLYQRAVELALHGRAGDSALAAARAWQQAEPGSRAATQITLQILLALNRTADIAEPLSKELAAMPANERPGYIASLPYGLTRLTDKALASKVVAQVLTPYLETPATAAVAWASMGRMQLAAGRADTALQAAQHAQQLDPSAAAAALLALDLMPRSEAEALVQRYLERADAQPEIQLAYSRALLEGHRPNLALTEVERLVKRAPDYAPGWLALGLMQPPSQPKVTAAALRRYLELTVNATTEPLRRGRNQALLSLAYLAEKTGDLTEASHLLDQVQTQEDALNLVSRRAGLLAKQGQFEAARHLLQSYAPQSEAEDRYKLLSEAQLLRDQQLYREAYDLLASGLTRYPSDHELLYEQALFAEKLDEFSTMEQLLRRAISLKPDYYHAYNALGYSLADRNLRLNEARQLITKALSYAPNDPMIQDSLGWVEFRSGNYAEAVRVLRAAYANQADPEIAAHLGEALWHTDQRPEALRILHDSQRQHPDSDVLKTTLERLQKTP